jgi:hypothetical protein
VTVDPGLGIYLDIHLDTAVDIPMKSVVNLGLDAAASLPVNFRRGPGPGYDYGHGRGCGYRRDCECLYVSPAVPVSLHLVVSLPVSMVVPVLVPVSPAAAAVMIVRLHVEGRLQEHYDEMTPTGRKGD